MKKANDEDLKHPFYSDEGVRLWKKRLKVLEQLEKDLQRRKSTNGESVQEIPTQET